MTASSFSDTSGSLEGNLIGENSSWLDAFSALDPKTFLTNFLTQNTRPDGRLLYQCRPTFLSLGVLTRNAAGSALIKIGDTQVLAAVTLFIGQPTSISTNTATTNEGENDNVNTGQEESSTATGGSGGGDLVVVVSSSGGGNGQSNYSDYSGRIQTILRQSGMIDFRSLVVIPKKAAWRLNITCQVLNDNGNIYDAALLASIAALTDTKLPSTKEEQDGMVYIVEGISGSNGDKQQGISSSQRLNILQHNIPIPLTISLYEIEKQQKQKKHQDDNDVIMGDNTTSDDDHTTKVKNTIMLADPTTLEQTHEQSSLTVVVIGCLDSKKGTTKPKILNVRLSGNIRLNASRELSVATHMAFGRAKEVMSLLQY